MVAVRNGRQTGEAFANYLAAIPPVCLCATRVTDTANHNPRPRIRLEPEQNVSSSPGFALWFCRLLHAFLVIACQSQLTL